ncbi:hypothetical protein COT78_00270 [Candidatus Berkelbacteria bacterium CG10_big_fil_rev_8_21_14_0_10_43_13]|uniref:Uncharacterized protein n=1 Tax=Candidatus Berkelbacteria bacterium CG10_big_fil_rev_8_21_14_0_10_43_13 TaxID=1974514 RepID=A0A2H0W7N1_9BACT|nr:MAG: hypothetical protein COT78_00270 [Candidatus Berkelbacteria bacterium CG10_big_fil_rev_8_21_14_0_10_43_13]
MQTVLDKIRGGISKVEIENEIKEIQNEQFSATLAPFIERYKTVGKRKEIFVFEWCYRINQRWMVLDVLDSEKNRLRDIKTLLNMFVVLIDDISEEKNNGDLLAELLKLPSGNKPAHINLNQDDVEYLQLTSDVWDSISHQVKQFPLYKKYKDCFDFDVFQLINAVKFGKFITDNKYHMNQLEYWQYFPNSMQIIINADLDLMCTPSFEESDLSKYREMILVTQKMARIGNWLTTWKREVLSDDYSSIVLPYAIDQNIISYDDLDNPELVISKIDKSDARQHFLDEWQKLYDTSAEIGKQIQSADYIKILNRFEYLLRMHLISDDLK